jgi:hypothetical protein
MMSELRFPNEVRNAYRIESKQEEQAMSTTERDIAENNRTTWTIYVSVGIISLLLIGGIIYIAKRPGATGAEQAKLEGAFRQGSPEFEKYKALITVDKPEATEGARAIGDIQMRLTTTVRNFTGKTIDGLEMRAAVVDMEGKPVKERTVTIIPNNVTGVLELSQTKHWPFP